MIWPKKAATIFRRTAHIWTTGRTAIGWEPESTHPPELFENVSQWLRGSRELARVPEPLLPPPLIPSECPNNNSRSSRFVPAPSVGGKRLFTRSCLFRIPFPSGSSPRASISCRPWWYVQLHPYSRPPPLIAPSCAGTRRSVPMDTAVLLSRRRISGCRPPPIRRRHIPRY